MSRNMAKTCQKCGIGNGITGSNQFILVLVGPFHVPTPQRWECSRCRSASRNVECFAGLLVPNLLVGNPICEALLHERDMRRLYLHQNRPICLLGDVSHSGWKLELPRLRSQTGVWEREQNDREIRPIRLGRSRSVCSRTASHITHERSPLYRPRTAVISRQRTPTGGTNSPSRMNG